jgi:hypothetical protein
MMLDYGYDPVGIQRVYDIPADPGEKGDADQKYDKYPYLNK